MLDRIYLTFDQDWAPAWATQDLAHRLERAGRSATLFITQPCAAVSEAAERGVFELGWHPNYLPGSSHGDSMATVLDTLAGWVPEATGVRAHSLIRGTPYLLEYGTRGLSYDTSDLLFLMPGIRPGWCWNGVVKLPIYWEDDVHLRHGLPIGLDTVPLGQPGLKVFNLHPVLLSLNSSDFEGYEALKRHLSGQGTPLTEASREDFAPFVSREKGVSDLLDELLGYLADHPDEAGGRLGDLAQHVRLTEGLVA